MCEEGHDDIIVRLEGLEKAFREYNGEVKDIRKSTTTIENYIIGDIDKDRPGLAERVRKLEDWVSNQKKLYYLLVSVFVTQIAGIIFGLIFLSLQK